MAGQYADELAQPNKYNEPGSPSKSTTMSESELITLFKTVFGTMGWGSGSGGGYGGGTGLSKKERARNLAAELNDRSKQLGLELTDKEIAALAKKAVDEDWNEAMISDELLRGFEWDTVTGGDLLAGVDLIRQMASGFLVPLDDGTAREYAARMARGEMSQQGLANMLQTQAKSRYAWMGNLIDQGVRPADYFAPVRNVIAQTLEVGADTIDLMDSKWMSLIEVNDGGTMRGATLTEAERAARRLPEFAKTARANQQMASTVRNMAVAFGRAPS